MSSVPVRSPNCRFSAVLAGLFLPIASPVLPSAQPPSLPGSCPVSAPAEPDLGSSSAARSGTVAAASQRAPRRESRAPGVNKPADTAPSPMQPERQALPVKELEDTQCGPCPPPQLPWPWANTVATLEKSQPPRGWGESCGDCGCRSPRCPHSEISGLA